MTNRILSALVVLVTSASCDTETAPLGLGLDETPRPAQTLAPAPAPAAPAPAAPAPAAPAPAPASAAPRAYDPASRRFVVHEWGTFTAVVGADGTVLPGLHHEEEDLPSFVADRLAQAQVTPTMVNAKMETPVTYFYAPEARTVSVKVGFPRGIFTQWFPYVQSTKPDVFQHHTYGPSPIDPWISTDISMKPACRAAIGVTDTFANGLLDWGKIEVLGPSTTSALAGPLGRTNWHLARNTAANPLRATVRGRTYDEKFLFYRGLGQFDLPLVTTIDAKCGAVTARPRDQRLGGKSLFLINVGETGAGFVRLQDVPSGMAFADGIPAADLPFSRYVADLKVALTQALVQDGLYTDEAQAMVDTWERSYFLTPGARLLYLLPRVLTDEIIPLTITPTPDEVVRTMVIRVELVTPDQERRLTAELVRLASTDMATRAAARSYFLSLGRFAEPHLTRALQMMPTAAGRLAGEALLVEVRAKRRWAPLAAE